MHISHRINTEYINKHLKQIRCVIIINLINPFTAKKKVNMIHLQETKIIMNPHGSRGLMRIYASS